MRQLSGGLKYRAVRNMDLQSVRPAGLQPAEAETADNMSAGRTGHSLIFRAGAPTSVAFFNNLLAFRRKPDYLQYALQVVGAVVFDFDSALFFAVMQNHAGAQIFLQPRLQMLHRAGIDRN